MAPWLAELAARHRSTSALGGLWRVEVRSVGAGGRVLLAEMQFVPGSGGAEEVRDAVEGYLAALYRNGQVCSEHVLGVVDGVIRAFVSVPDPDAFAPSHACPWVERELEAVRALCAREPSRVVLEHGERSPSVADTETFYLFTHAFDVTSPLCSGRDGRPVALYAVPLDPLERGELVDWQAAYRHHDSIALSCGTLEVPAYKELASVDSGLTRKGRELARTVERRTSRPTYYYLQRYWGRRAGEEQRACPGCGGAWAVPAGERSRGLGWFDFRCDACRLVSHVAASHEDERRAHIGEFRSDR